MQEYSKDKKREIGKRIREARESRGLSARDLCRLAGFPTVKALSKIENGVTVPKGERLGMLAKALHMPGEEILEGKAKDQGRGKEMMATSMAATPSKAPREEARGAAAQLREMEALGDPAKTFLKTKGSAIRKERERIQFTQKDVAEICKTTNTAVSAWETGKHRISLANAKLLSGLYKVPLEQIADPASASHERGCSKKGPYLAPDGEAIRRHRIQAGLTTEEAAELCGVTKWTAQAWEAERFRISESDVQTLAEYFGIGKEELVKAEGARSAGSKAATPKGQVKTGTARIRPKAIAALSSGTAAQTARKKEEEVKEFAIPESPEEPFCRNILYYASEKADFSEKDFEDFAGCSLDFFGEALQHGYKLPLSVVLKSARYFGKSVEEVACDGTAQQIKQKIMEMEKAIRDLKKKIGA